MTYGNLLIHSFIIVGSERPLGPSRPQTAARLLSVFRPTSDSHAAIWTTFNVNTTMLVT